MDAAVRGWCLVLLAGCNGLLGLDSTRVEDADNDGIVDVLDNCPDLANADQADVDDDGIGDACDTCVGCVVCDKGPQHDEDGDTIADGCDNCPTIDNLEQTNTDGDDLGDACDPDNATMQKRVFFDGFGTIDDAIWGPVGGLWHAVGDAAEPIDGPHDLGYRLVLRSQPIEGTSHWTLETVVDVPVEPVMDDQVGVFVDRDDSTHHWPCLLSYDGTTWNVLNGLPVPVTIDGGPRKLTLSSLRDGSTDHVCTVDPLGDFIQQAVIQESYPLSVELFARTLTRFDYIEVIQ